MAVFIDLWPCLLTTKLSYAQLFKWGHSNVLEWVLSRQGWEKRYKKRKEGFLDHSNLAFFHLSFIPMRWCFDFFLLYYYTAGWNVWGEWLLAVNHHNHKNWVPSILTHNLWLIFMGINEYWYSNTISERFLYHYFCFL